MKTTLELPDELFVEAKTVAAQRRITLKELFTRALEKELHPLPSSSPDDHFFIDEHGWPVLKRKAGHGIVITEEFLNQLRDEEGV